LTENSDLVWTELTRNQARSGKSYITIQLTGLAANLSFSVTAVRQPSALSEDISAAKRTEDRHCVSLAALLSIGS